MAQNKKESYFWTSFSDLMTSMFFVMLVLFVLTIVLMERKRRATQAQLDKIAQIDSATKNISSKYFEYNDAYKKHVLKIKVNFPKGRYKINQLSKLTRDSLRKAGEAIQRSLEKINR